MIGDRVDVSHHIRTGGTKRIGVGGGRVIRQAGIEGAAGPATGSADVDRQGARGGVGGHGEAEAGPTVAVIPDVGLAIAGASGGCAVGPAKVTRTVMPGAGVESAAEGRDAADSTAPRLAILPWIASVAPVDPVRRPLIGQIVGRAAAGRGHRAAQAAATAPTGS